MDKNPMQKQMSRLFIPILIYWVIGFAVKFIAEIAVLTPHMAEIIGSTVMTQQQLMENAMNYAGKMFEILMEYQVQIAAAGSLFTIPYTLYLFKKDKREATVKDKKKDNNIVNYVKLIVLGIIACIGLNSIALMMNLAMADEAYQQTSTIMYNASFGVQILCLGIIIPAAEELMFRGIIYKRFRQYATFVRAAVFSALMFSLAHGNFVQMLYAFAIGMLLTFVYEKFDSFAAPLFFHISVNITSLIVTKVGGFTWLYSDTMRMAVASVACAFLGSILFVQMRSMKEKEEITETPKDNEPKNDMNVYGR